MMAWHAGYSISGTGNRHFCGLERGIVSSSKAPVFGEALKCCISQIADYKTTYVAEFLQAGPMPTNVSALQ